MNPESSLPTGCIIFNKSINADSVILLISAVNNLIEKGIANSL